MSNIFLTDNIKKMLEFSETENNTLLETDSTIGLSKYFVNNSLHKSKKNLNGGNILSDTSSNLASQLNNNNFSATSSDFADQINNKKQNGSNDLSDTSSNLASQLNNNNFSATSSNLASQINNTKNIQNGGNNIIENNSINNNLNDNNNDIKQLLSLISTETEENHNKINPDLNNMKKYFIELKNNGIDVKLNNMSPSMFFNNMHNTTTELKNSENTEQLIHNIENMLNTTSEFQDMTGGKKTKSKNEKLKRTPSQGFLEFNKFKNLVMSKLNIKSPIEGASKASEIRKKVAAKNPDIANDTVKLLKAATEYFNNHVDDFK